MARNSHTYDFDFKWFASHLGLLLLLIAMIAGMLHVCAPFLPAPRATWDMDRTIMATKADLAMRDEGADIVLIGDSSCLICANLGGCRPQFFSLLIVLECQKQY
ncbi:hypothetical protein OAH76_02905 [Verrucomicrobia bacterium]|nr:hypothetical protein [Verrucomicrobiota bacterium]